MIAELEVVLTRARALAADDLPNFLGDLETIRAVAWSRLTAAATTTQQACDELISIEQAAGRLGLSPSYLYRNHQRQYVIGRVPAEQARPRSDCPQLKRWLVRTIWAALLIFVTVVVGGAVDARRRLPDLESWHRYVPADATASDLETATLAEYLRREDTVFRRRPRSDRAHVRRDGVAAGQPLRQPQPIASLAHRLGRQPHLRDRARRRDGRRRPADSRSHRLTVQHARGRRDVEGSRLLRSGAADARARHRAGRPHHGRLGGLACRRPCRRSPCASSESAPTSRSCWSATRTAARSR